MLRSHDYHMIPHLCFSIRQLHRNEEGDLKGRWVEGKVVEMVLQFLDGRAPLTRACLPHPLHRVQTVLGEGSDDWLRAGEVPLEDSHQVPRDAWTMREKHGNHQREETPSLYREMSSSVISAMTERTLAFRETLMAL